LTYFVGYLIVAYNPARHTGIVIVGGIGKIAFAIKLLLFYLNGWARPLVFLIIIGDIIFGALFVYYLVKLYLDKKELI